MSAGDSVLGRLGLAAALAVRQTRWLAGDRSPFISTLKLTYRCNLRCRHCPWVDLECIEMDTEAWKAKMSELRRRGVRHFVLEGGEPTLRDDLVELIAHARAIGGVSTLSTNGTRDLSPYEPDRFLVSVDGLPETHDAIRGEGAFDRMIGRVRAVDGLKHSLTTLSRRNRTDIIPMMERLAGVIDGFWFSFLYDYGANQVEVLGPEEIRDVAAELLELTRDYPIINNVHSLSRVGTSRPCRPWLLVTMTPDGREVSECMVGR